MNKDIPTQIYYNFAHGANCQNERLRDNPKLIERKYKNCTTAYLISRAGIRNLLQCSNNILAERIFMKIAIKIHIFNKTLF